MNSHQRRKLRRRGERFMRYVRAAHPFCTLLLVRGRTAWLQCTAGCMTEKASLVSLGGGAFRMDELGVKG